MIAITCKHRSVFFSEPAEPNRTKLSVFGLILVKSLVQFVGFYKKIGYQFDNQLVRLFIF